MSKLILKILPKAASVAAFLGFLRLWPGSSESSKDKLIVFQLVVKYPVVTILENQLKHFDLIDTIVIFQLHNFKVYKLPGKREFETHKRIHGTETYFAFDKSQKFGHLFPSLQAACVSILPVDSFLAKKAYSEANFDMNAPYRLIATIPDISNHSVLYKYVLPNNKDELTIDSINYSFTTTMADIDHSFSKNLDSIMKSKLYKASMILNERYSSQYNRIIPRREILFEIKKIQSTERASVSDFLERYIQFGCNQADKKRK